MVPDWLFTPLVQVMVAPPVRGEVLSVIVVLVPCVSTPTAAEQALPLTVQFSVPAVQGAPGSQVAPVWVRVPLLHDTVT